MHHRIRLVLRKEPIECSSISNVFVREGVALVARCRAQRFEIPGVGQLVDIENRVIGVRDDVSDERGSNEAGTSRNEDLHGDGLCLEEGMDACHQSIAVPAIAIFEVAIQSDLELAHSQENRHSRAKAVAFPLG